MARPFVTLKLATSLDGKIALANGQSEWITCEKSRRAGRRLRGSHDAIAVGANTACLDNPQLTTRINGMDDPIRVIFDTNLRLPLVSNLVDTAKDIPVWVFCASSEGPRADALRGRGVQLFAVASDQGLDVNAALGVLHRKNVSRLLVEGGGQLAASFIQAGAVDVIEWFRAPVILGGDGRNGIGPLGLTDLKLSKHFTRASISELGDDVHERYERK